MSESKKREQELQRKEKELIEREKTIKLREMEAEINQQQEVKFYQTETLNKSESVLTIWKRKIIKYGKLLALVVGGIAIVQVGIYISTFLMYVLMASAVIFIGYQVFFPDNKS